MSDCFGDCEQRELKNRVLKLEAENNTLKVKAAEAENERLREALREIADGKYEHYLGSNPSQNAATVFAKSALEENNDE